MLSTDSNCEKRRNREEMRQPRVTRDVHVGEGARAELHVRESWTTHRPSEYGVKVEG